MSETEWVQCDDPELLAAAVAAGVEVQWERYDGWVPSANQTADQFAGSLRAGITYRIPTDWSPEPPADDEPCATNPCEACRGRAVRATDECTLSPDRVGSPAGNDHPVTIPPDGCEAVFLPIDVVDRISRDGVGDIADACREAQARRGTTPTAPPVPPWPGAVLSGLVDEDGVPTWLAQAGQVRGEQVRACTSVPWLPNTSYGEDEWVEVRAPRAVPEPETERGWMP